MKRSRSTLSKLLLVAAATVVAPVLNAGVMHSDATFQTYADFGQNKGRYVVGASVNALLSHIREKENGIGIVYTDGTAPFFISNTQGMINFAGTDDCGAQVAVGPNFMATVLHNGAIDASFGTRVVGAEHAINYSAIDIRNSDVFRLAPDGWGNGTALYDYMLQRQSKIITDAVWNPVTSVKAEELSSLNNTHLYHSGAGSMALWKNGQKQGVAGAYAFIIGGINNINNAQWHSNNKTNISLHQDPSYGNGIGATESNPLPNGIQGGDSGSPVFIYNSETKQYEYIAAQQSGGGNSYGQARGNIEWTHEALAKFNVDVDMSETKTVYLNAITTAGETKTDVVNNVTYTTTLYSGAVTTDVDGTTALTDADGNSVAYTGIQSGKSTWRDLSPEKDKNNWYAYADGANAGSYLQQSDADLFFTENLVFSSEVGTTNTIILNATVDLGIGYTEFKNGTFIISSAQANANESGTFLLNSAGYVVNEGAEVHVRLNNPDNYMYEWRKNGAGDLYLDGNGDTNALLTVGGSGKTYLQQTDGYAAYNVLASSGATVVIKDIAQIKRDFTFGAGGGTLDMNGNSMLWTNSSDPEATGFSIHALTEEAVLANYKANSVSALFYTEAGDQTWKGSFKDSANSALQIFYNGGEASTWTLNSIHTDLQNENSAFVVQSGKVSLVGTNTVHGMGSAGSGAARIEVADDWHYADAKMNVTVDSDATFELGSHARLRGDINVANGGTYLMREGVKDRYEYIEGGQILEDTYEVREFYGHHGNTQLAAGAEMRVEYSAGTTSQNVYDGDISGDGNMSVALGTNGASLVLSGNNTFTGTKTLESGTLIDDSGTGLGNLSRNKWIVKDDGVIASVNFTSEEAVFDAIDSSSTGVLALQEDMGNQLNLDTHSGLIVGALEGKVVRYGNEGEVLTAYNNQWVLGGGGGELVVLSKLTGENNLVLGNASGKGVVKLANAANDFSGEISFAGGVTLDFDDKAALGQSKIDLSYTNRVYAIDGGTANIKAGSDGVLLIDRVEENATLDVSANPELTIGAEENKTFSGTINLADDADYRFGGTEKTLTLNTVLSGDRNLIVDAQTYSGGKIHLAQAATITGDVSVIGADSDKTASTDGSIALSLGADNALASASSVSIRKGGTLDIASTTQHIKSLTASEESSITDNSRGGTLSVESGTVSGSFLVTKLVKTGEGALALSGNSSVSEIDLNSGSLAISGNATAGQVNLNAGTLSLSGSAYRIGTLAINAGASYDIKGNGGDLGNRISTIRLNGGTLANTGGNVGTNLRQIYHLELGADSAIHAASSFGIIGSGYAATSLDLAGHTLNKTGIGTLSLINTSVSAGTLKVSGGVLSWDDMGKAHNSTIDASVIIDSGIVQISKSGGGTLTLNGERTDVTLLQLTNGAVTVNGGRINVGSFSGTGGTFTLADATLGTRKSTLSVARDIAISGTATIDTQVQGTTTVGEITVSGNVSGGNLVKDGLGSLTLSGTTSVNDLTVRQGALVISGESTLPGNIAIAQGAFLMLSDTLSLNAGQSLSVLASSEGGTAFLASTLSLNGGSLSFSGETLSAEFASLASGAISLDESVNSTNITFANAAALAEGESYWLVTGDFGTITADKFTASGIEYFDADFTVQDDGLRVEFSAKEGYSIWNGTNETWNTEAVAVFNDSATNKQIALSENIAAAGMIFDTTEEYSVSGSGKTVTTDFLTVRSGGTVAMTADLNVTGELSVRDSTLGVTGTTTVGGNATLSGGTLSLAGNTNLGGDLQVSNGIALIEGDLTVAGNVGVSNNGILALRGTTEIDGSVSVNDGRLNVAGDTATLGTVTLSGSSASATFASENATLNKAVVNGGTLTLASDNASVSTLEANGGTTKITSGNANINSITMETGAALEIGSADSTGPNVTVDTLKIHSLNRGTTETVTMNSGTLTIEKSSTGTAEADFGVLIGHWNSGKGVFNLNGGTVNAKNAYTLLSWDSEAELNINGGTYNAYGISMNTARSADNATLNLSGGRLNIGAGGIVKGSVSGSVQKTFNFSGGTLGTLADSWSSAQDIKLSGKATIDTQVVGTNNAGTIELTGTLHGTGQLEKVGAGTLVLSGANIYSGGTRLAAGTLKVKNASALGLGNLVIDNGATLQIVTEGVYVAGGITFSESARLVIDLADFAEQLDGDAMGLSILAGTSLTFESASQSIVDFSGLVVEDSSGNYSAQKDNGTWNYDESTSALTFAWGEFTPEALSMTNGFVMPSNVSAVPEPSAFGLLAGLGALALVAARRRRKKA